MDDEVWMVQRFEEHRSRMKSVAARMLGSATEADDALQEAWLRFSRSDTTGVGNLGGWLTTVVSRVCLDMLQARRRRTGVSLDAEMAEVPADAVLDTDPEQEAVLADSVGLALLVVLDTLTPAERVALVLHDMFGVPFDDIGSVIGRNPAATRQVASRARRRVRDRVAPEEADRLRQAALVEAFLAAARAGDFHGLLSLLDPNVVLHADEAAAALGSRSVLRGADAVGATLQQARGAQAALINGEPGAVWAPGGKPRVILRFTIEGDRIVEVNAIANKDEISRTDLILVS